MHTATHACRAMHIVCTHVALHTLHSHSPSVAHAHRPARCSIPAGRNRPRSAPRPITARPEQPEARSRAARTGRAQTQPPHRGGGTRLLPLARPAPPQTFPCQRGGAGSPRWSRRQRGSRSRRRCPPTPAPCSASLTWHRRRDQDRDRHPTPLCSRLALPAPRQR